MAVDVPNCWRQTVPGIMTRDRKKPKSLGSVLFGLNILKRFVFGSGYVN